MESIIEQLLQSPKLSLYVEQLQATLQQEKLRRQDFYNYIREDQKAEFINGEVIIHSPVMKRHNAATGLLYKLMSTYAILHDLGFVGVEKIMITLTRNDYEPDICFFNQEKSVQFAEDQKLFPAPDLIVEVLSDSTKKIDRGIKFEDYQAHGIQEYWMVDPEQKLVEQYILSGNTYNLALKSDNGIIKSHVLAGFDIPVQAIFDEKINISTLNQLINQK